MQNLFPGLNPLLDAVSLKGNHAQPGQLVPIAHFVERRTMRRSDCALDITVRQRGCFAVAGATADLTPYGARLSGAGPFAHNSEMWLRLPGLESLTVRVIWSHGPTTGVAFIQPLHPAVFARFLPADSRLMLVEEDHSNTVCRTVIRPPEHRREDRYSDALRTGPMRLTVGSCPAQVRNVSASGLKVAANIEADVGTHVAVKFEGFDVMAAQIMWRDAEEIGLSLPVESLELFDA